MKKFEIGKNNIRYIGSDFKKWFGDMLVGKGQKLTSQKLPRRMNDREVLTELKPQEVTLGDVLETLKILDKRVRGIFYVKNKDNVLCAVDVYWFVGFGWRVDAFSVLDGRGWLDGSQVFSRNFGTQTFDPSASSDTLSLGSLDPLLDAINTVKKAGYVVYKQM